MWYLLEDDDRILTNMDHTRARLRHLRTDPQSVSLTFLNKNDWHTAVSAVDWVSDLPPDSGLRDINRISQHYVRTAYHDQESPRVSGWTLVDRWRGWRRSRAITPAKPT